MLPGRTTWESLYQLQFFPALSPFLLFPLIPYVTNMLFFDVGFPDGSGGKESTLTQEMWVLTPGSGRSLGEGRGNPLQYSCLENSIDRGAWWATVQEVAKSGMTE